MWLFFEFSKGSEVCGEDDEFYVGCVELEALVGFTGVDEGSICSWCLGGCYGGFYIFIGIGGDYLGILKE